MHSVNGKKEVNKSAGSPNKPKVPVKPLHLAYVHHKSASFPSPSKSEEAKKSGLEEHRKKSCTVPDSRKKPLIDLGRRRSSNAILRTHEAQDNLLSPRPPSPLENNLEITEDDGDYVVINYPSVRPGTIIRSDESSGDIQMLPNSSSPVVTKRTTARSSSDSALSHSRDSTNFSYDQRGTLAEELEKNFGQNHREASHSLPARSTADECGYEIPIAFQTPTYMTLDEIETLPEQSAVASTQAHEEPKVCRHKKVRLARYKRHMMSQSSTSLEEEEELSKPTPDSGSQEDEVIEVNKMVLTPINSFLSSRIKSCAANCLKKHDHDSARSRNSLGSSGMTYSTSGSDEDDFSDDEFDTDSHYQQINLPCSNVCENAYERIYEILHSNQFPTGPSGRRHPYEYVDIDFSDPNPTPCKHGPHQHDLKKFSEMRPNSADCTWNTVATPGVLKLSNFKKTAENCYTVP